MKTHFAFGRNGIDITLPAGFNYQLIESRTAPALTNARLRLRPRSTTPSAARRSPH